MKKIIQFVSFLTILTLTFSGCSNQKKAEPIIAEPIDMENLKVEIQAMEDAFSAAEKAMDADAVALYYSENAISYSRNKQPTSGRAAIKESIAKSIAADTLGEYNVYKVVDLFAEGNTALEVGSWTQFDGSGTEKENGYYMSYFEKRDGKYECVRDMNVSTKPVMEGM
jgi:ketosteroid isomerase-like protein